MQSEWQKCPPPKALFLGIRAEKRDTIIHAGHVAKSLKTRLKKPVIARMLATQRITVGQITVFGVVVRSPSTNML
jgi:hypothetical protein